MGVLFGIVLSGIGFTSWDEVHRMFALSDLRLLFVFATAVPLLAMAWFVLSRFRGDTWSPKTMHPGVIPGGILFGIGWALTGACPSIVVVQLGEGQLAAAWTIVGVFVGNFIYSLMHQRYFHWTTTGCTGD